MTPTGLSLSINKYTHTFCNNNYALLSMGETDILHPLCFFLNVSALQWYEYIVVDMRNICCGFCEVVFSPHVSHNMVVVFCMISTTLVLSSCLTCIVVWETVTYWSIKFTPPSIHVFYNNSVTSVCVRERERERERVRARSWTILFFHLPLHKPQISTSSHDDPGHVIPWLPVLMGWYHFRRNVKSYPWGKHPVFVWWYCLYILPYFSLSDDFSRMILKCVHDTESFRKIGKLVCENTGVWNYWDDDRMAVCVR